MHGVLRQIRHKKRSDGTVYLYLPEKSLDILQEELPATTIQINTGVHVDANNRYLDSDGGYSFDIIDYQPLEESIQDTIDSYIRLTVTTD